jgi:hypothetical protein
MRRCLRALRAVPAQRAFVVSRRRGRRACERRRGFVLRGGCDQAHGNLIFDGAQSIPIIGGG